MGIPGPDMEGGLPPMGVAAIEGRGKRKEEGGRKGRSGRAL